MPSGNAVWGIDIGQCALKAIKLRVADGGNVEAVAFDVIEHPKILSQPDADRDELIKSALEKFASRNAWQGDQFVVGVPGQQTFARFCKMPPIEKKDAKKIHDLVRYEASQQIPFDIEDVVWDYQVFATPDAPDLEVGIFAIRKDLIRKHLGYFAAVGIAPASVQTIPAALYNFAQFDGQMAEGGATVIVDVGAQNTDLIIVESNSAWTRNIPLGGNSFSEALVRAFKLSFAKAENLKRSAATSKYARQIFQAMRPVFAELVAEIQRSIGFYSSTHRDVQLRKVLALGNAFRLPGLQKYLENNLTIPGGVAKLERFGRMTASATLTAPQFTDNILSFAAAYGLAVQGLELAKITTSLLPPELARIAVWQKKRPYFMAAAASFLLAAAIPLVANQLDRQALDSTQSAQELTTAKGYADAARQARARYQQAQSDTDQKEQAIKDVEKLTAKRAIVPRLLAMPFQAMPPLNPPELTKVTSGAELKKLILSNPAKFDRTQRGQFIIEKLEIRYVKDVESEPVAATAETPQNPYPGITNPGGYPGRGGPGMPPYYPGRGGPGMPPYYPGMGPTMGPTAQPAGSGTGAGGGGGTGGTGQEEAAKDPGFVVRIHGRLLYGKAPNKSDAYRWMTDYINRLRETGSAPGLEFYIPDDDPKNNKLAVGQPLVNPYWPQGTAAPKPPTTMPGPEVQNPDPVTGEETKNDWAVDLIFKVRLGEKKPAGTNGATPAPPKATP